MCVEGGGVAVPTGCEVATVVAVLQATDFYQVRGDAGVGFCLDLLHALWLSGG